MVSNEEEPSRSRYERTLRFFAEEFDGLVMLLGVGLVGFANLFGKLNSLRDAALVIVFVALSVRVFRIKYQLSDAFARLLGRSESIRKEVLSVQTIFASSKLHEAEMCDRPGFYRHMLAALRSATKTVDLTQLDAQAPMHYGTPEMVEYFELQTRMVRECPAINFRRIVAIPTHEKLEWVLDVLDRVKDCPNFQINVIDISQSGSLPPPLSLQIFDRKEMCLVDPTLGFMLPEDQQHMLWVRGYGVCQVFSVYYDSIWNLGQRLKSGTIIFWPVLENIAKDLNARFPEKRAQSRALVSRMRMLSGKGSEVQNLKTT